MGKPEIDLKSLRERRGWTKTEAAKKLGFCRSYVTEVENGTQGISVKMIRAIIKVFDVKYEDFYQNTESNLKSINDLGGYKNE